MHDEPNPSGLCQCGCGRPTPLAGQTRSERGQRKGQPVRFIHGHNTRRPIEDRFWEKVDQSLSCWDWRGANNGVGYGHFTPEHGVMVLAHRFAYELLVGPIPEGLVIDHLCRNPACVNPDHLEPVTFGENVRRGHAAKLTHDDVAQIRRLAAQGRTQKSIAADYGIAKGAVSLIVRRVSWAY